MNSSTKKLIEAEKKAIFLFQEIEKRGLIIPGKTEKNINTEIYNLAFELFGIKLYWHKRIVRAGKNTLKPYNENPENLTLQKDDILFIDFGPVFEEWEADFGRTYVIGNDPLKTKLSQDIEKAWWEGKEYFDSKKQITGAELYAYTHELAKKYEWFGAVVDTVIAGVISAWDGIKGLGAWLMTLFTDPLEAAKQFFTLESGIEKYDSIYKNI